MTTSWTENYCLLRSQRTVLMCELRTVEGETAPYHVILNLLHYAGPGTYPAKGERATANVVTGVLLETAVQQVQQIPPVGGTVVITSGTRNASQGAPVGGRINADVQDKTARDGAIRSPVHISGTFTTPLVVGG
jgi:hypothetical protein